MPGAPQQPENLHLDHPLLTKIIWYDNTVHFMYIDNTYVPSWLPAPVAVPRFVSLVSSCPLLESSSLTLTPSSVCCWQPKKWNDKPWGIQNAKTMQHWYETHSFNIKLYTQFLTVTELKGQSVTILLNIILIADKATGWTVMNWGYVHDRVRQFTFLHTQNASWTYTASYKGVDEGNSFR